MNPVLWDDFTAKAECPHCGYVANVEFSFNHGSTQAPYGTCEECGGTVEWSEPYVEVLV